METLSKFQTSFRHFASSILAILLLSMFITFLMQITFRYILGWSVGWTIEWVAIAWLWGILFGYAFVVQSSDEIRLDIVYSAVSPTMRRVFDVFAGLTCAAIFTYTLPSSWEYISFMGREKTAYMHWPFNLVFSIYIPFAVVVIYRSLSMAVRGFLGRPDPTTKPEAHDYD